MKYVLDTTSVSAAMMRDEGLFRFLKNYRPGDIATAPPVVAEIQYGIERLQSSSRKRKLLQSERDRVLSMITVLPWSPESSERFGKIKADLERRGSLIDDFDIAIGAIAMAHGCAILTKNLDHFQIIADLECKSWQMG